MSVETNKTKSKMTEEMAVEEFYGFISKWKKRPGTQEEVATGYIDCVDALMDGRLVINENKEPVYTLSKPVGDKSEITFKTRIKPSDAANIADGFDVQKQRAKYGLRMICHVAGIATVNELDMLEKDDYDVVSQLSTVFM